jgi:hypothetical protein
MARQLRFPLLLVLACLTIALVLKSTPAAAESPNCNDGVPGPHSSCNDIQGWQSPSCGEIVFCTIGHICFQWDCEFNEGGDLVISNVMSAGPQLCYCNPFSTHCC